MPTLRKRKKIDLAENDDSGSETSENSDVEEAEVEPRASPARTERVRRTAQAASRTRKRKGTAVPDDASLFEAVRSSNVSLTGLAKKWVQDYEADRMIAAANLLTLFVKACGCGTEVTADEVEEDHVDKLVQRLVDHASKDGLDEPFKGKGAKAFHGNFLEFWESLVQEAATAEILFDSFMLEKITHLLIPTSCSAIRNFRTVATMAAMQLVTSMIRIISSLTEALGTAQRQLDAEEKRKSSKVAADRARGLKRSIDQIQYRISELKGHIKVVFEAVAAHRFRDISEEVRATVIQGIGQWIALLPAEFLADAYLKYLAWALSDKDAIVREAAAMALITLYSTEENVSPLHVFTVRFSPRFGELIYDISESVAVKGIQLVTTLVKLDEVEGSAVRDVYRLLGDDSHAIRHAAAELVADLLEQMGERQLQPASKGSGRRSSGARHSKKELQLAGLLYIMFLLANDEENDDDTVDRRRRLSSDGLAAAEKPLDVELVNSIVDALFDKVEVLTDWKVLVAALEAEDSGQQLTDAAITNIIRMLRACVHKGCGGTLVAARHDARKGQGKQQKAAVEERRQTATLLFMKSLPGLLRKYQTDHAKAAALASILPDLHLEVFSLRKAESALEALLRLVADVFMKHVEPETLDCCMRALMHATAQGSDATKEHARLVLDSTAEAIAKRLSTSADAVQSSSDSQLELTPEDNDEGSEAFTAKAALLRAERLQLLSDALAPNAAFNDALKVFLKASADGRQLGADIIGGTARNAFLLLLWRLHALDAAHPQAEDLATLAAARSQLTALIETSFQVSSEDAVRDRLFAVLGDLYLVFGATRFSSGPLAQLHGIPSEAALHRLWTFCEELLDQSLEQPSDGEEDDAGTADTQAALEAKQERAVLVIGRLVVFGGAEWRVQLAPQLLSHYVAHGKRVEATVKDICRQLKKADAAAMPAIYVAAMRAAFERTQRFGAPEDFLALADRIAASYAGFNASIGAVEAVCRGVARYALRDAPQHMAFLTGLKHFASKLPADKAESFAASLEADAAEHSPDDAEDAWQPFYNLLDMLRDRAVKGKTPRGALKKGGQGTGAKAPPSGRRISFAAADVEEGDSVEDEPEVEVRERDIRVRKSGRRPQDEVEDFIEQPEMDLRAASEDERSAAEAAGDSGGEEEAMETDEQPSRRKSAAASRSAKPKRKRRVMRTMYASSSAEGEEGGSDDDSLLHADEVPSAKRGKAATGTAGTARGGKKRGRLQQQSSGSQLGASGIGMSEQDPSSKKQRVKMWRPSQASQEMDAEGEEEDVAAAERKISPQRETPQTGKRRKSRIITPSQISNLQSSSPSQDSPMKEEEPPPRRGFGSRRRR